MNEPYLCNRARHVHRVLKIFKFAGFPLFTAALAVFFGCKGSLSTYHAASSSVMVNGMAYYLPVGKITVKGEFAAQPSPSAPPTISPANGAKKDSTSPTGTTEDVAATTAESPPGGKAPTKEPDGA